MYSSFLKPFFLLFWITLGTSLLAQTGTVQLVLLDVFKQEDIYLCYTNKCDGKKVPITYQWSDTINTIDDLSFNEEPVPAADCFIPELKLVFEKYTYVVSIYCSGIIMYKNSAPFVASATKLRSNIAMTPSTIKYFKQLRRRYFGGAIGSRVLIEKTVLTQPLPDPEQEQKDVDHAIIDDDDEDRQDDDSDIDTGGTDEFNEVKVEVPNNEPDDFN